MQSLWNDADARQYEGDLAQRVYTSRLLGKDKTLVVHGGGNTSVKIDEENLFAERETILYVKGSGSDLATIDVSGFAPVRLIPLLKLVKLEALSDTQMANELRTAMTNASAPRPSVESILHAVLPHKFVDHTHANAVISVTNAVDGRARVEEIYGDSMVIIPYVMPGFRLARLCAEIYAAHATDRTQGLILMNHGIFTFGATARESYERMIELTDRAEDYLKARNAWMISFPQILPSERPLRTELALLRREIASVVGAPVIMMMHADAQALSFARRDDISVLSQQGPLTPDHVIHTRHVPLIGRDVQGYIAEYEGYFAEHHSRAAGAVTMLDPAPRVLLDPEYGMITVGKTAKGAVAAEDIYRHTINVILRAAALGGYQSISAADVFDVEYWDLEQAKLRSSGKPPAFTGEIALVTGAASGIGKACVAALMACGAAVIGVDINEAVESLHDRVDYFGVRCDVSDESQLTAALESAIRHFGGLDMLVLNAGVFPGGTPIKSLMLADWERVMRINLDSNLVLMREVHPLLKASPNGGRVVVVGSKNVPAPGPGAAAYSASKAALNQLARVAALEWGADGIRVNVIHPNAVFDTGLWTDEVLASRAAHYGMTVEAYKTNNVLHVEVTSRDVAELIAAMCGQAFSRTTGAQVPIDGGNDRVI